MERLHATYRIRPNRCGNSCTNNVLLQKLSTPEKDTNVFTTLKYSLSKVLVHFYPLAGRLRWLEGSRLELNCNGKGVQLIEASCDAKLDDLGDFATSPYLHYLVPNINYRDDPIEEIPLFIAQITKFSCGGLTLSSSLSHLMSDGQSSLHFISEWARLARGEPLGAQPFLDRKVLRAGDPPRPHHPLDNFKPDQSGDPPLLIGQLSNESESRKETELAMLKLSKIQVEMLKKEANNMTRTCGDSSVRAYTRYESIVGHIWRSSCKARGHVHEQPTSVGLCVDIRRRMEPPLPEKFFGNGIEYMVAKGLSGELMMRPLGYAAGIIRQAIDKVTSEYVHSATDFWKNQKDLSGWQDIRALMINNNDHNQQRPFYGNPNLEVVSWMGLPLDGMDFGWGKEIFVTPVMSESDGDSLVMPGYDEDGTLVVAICLQSECMEDFKKFFYQDIQTCNPHELAA